MKLTFLSVSPDEGLTLVSFSSSGYLQLLRSLGSWVLKASVVECRSFDPQLTLRQDLHQYSVNIRLTLDWYLDWHSTDSWSIVGRVLINSYASINTRWCVCEISWLSTKMSIECWPSIDGDIASVLTKMLIECWPRCRLSVDWASIEGIDRHLTGRL